MSSAAELALKKKFALLQKKKDAASGGKAGGGRAAAAAPAAAAQDPARQAAIKRLQAQRAEAEAKAAAGRSAAAAPAPAAPREPQAPKVRLVIPKREAPQDAAPLASTQPGRVAAGAGPGRASAPAPSDPTRAAALAAMRAKAAQQQQRPAGAVSGPAAAATAVPASAGVMEATGLAAQPQQQQQQLKRPALKRPSARSRPAPQPQAAADGTFTGDDSQQQQQHQQQQDVPLGGEGSYYGDAEAGEDERYTKQQRLEQHGGIAAGGGGGGGGGGEGGEGATTLFVGDLPQFWAGGDLHDFFASDFGEVLEARVIGSQCYGFVTFASPADAENVLEFAKQQGIWADERMLRINWAQGSMPGWKKGPAVHHDLDPGEPAPALEAYEHPRVKEARLQAQQLAATVDAKQLQDLAMQRPPERQLVSYEDL